MTIHDFEVNYATLYKDKSGVKLQFNPLHKKNTGSLITTNINGFKIGGEYTLRSEWDNLYITFGGNEYLIRPTEKGLNLIIGQTECYNLVWDF